MSNSIYDIPLKSWDGTENMLEKYKGKVTMVINVTGDCGNAPQYGVIETMYRKYKDAGFEVLAVPTNDYCGPGITYNEFECGITTPETARDYAIDLYDVTYDFSELITSNPGPAESKEFMDANYPGRKEAFPRQLEEGEEVHPLYQGLTAWNGGAPIFGNFEKFLVDKNGKVAQRYPNGTLLDYAYEGGDRTQTSGEDYEMICKAIEELLENKYVSPEVDVLGRPLYSFSE